MGQWHTHYRSYAPYSGTILVGDHFCNWLKPPPQHYHSYTHALLAGVEEEDTSPSGSPVRLQENTELLSVCGLTGTPQRVSLLGLGGKGCAFGVHSVNVEDVGLRLPLLAEFQLVVCVISAAYFSTAWDCTSSP